MVNLKLTQQAHIEVMDMNGREVFTERNALGLTQFTTSAWTNGLYIVVIRDNQGETHCLKLIKQ